MWHPNGKNNALLEVLKETYGNFMPLPTKEACVFCKKKKDISSLQACSRCRFIYYCGTDCQKRDWKSHKKTCIPTQTAEKDLCEIYLAEQSSGAVLFNKVLCSPAAQPSVLKPRIIRNWIYY